MDADKATFESVKKQIQTKLTLEYLQKHRHNQILFDIPFHEIQPLLAALSACSLSKHYFNDKAPIREYMQELMDLGPNDMVLFTEDHMYVKLFAQIQMPQEGEKRACGLDADMLEKHKEEHFPKDRYRTLAFALLPFVCEDILSFRRITPMEFKKLFVSTLVNLFEIIICTHTSIKDYKLIRGFAYYLLRDVFDDLILYIADEILFHFANQSRKAAEFLTCFSVNDTIAPNGMRYKANPILDQSKRVWNMTTIRSTILQHKKAKQAVYEKKNSILSIKEKLNKQKKEQAHLKSIQAQKEEEFTHLEKTLLGIKKTIEKLEESESEDVIFKDGDKEISYKRKPLLQKMMIKERNIQIQMNEFKHEIKEVELSISNKQKNIEIWEKRYQEDKEILANIDQKGHPTDKMYDAIKWGLAKAMTKR